MTTAIENFYAKVVPIMDDRGCWEWLGAMYPTGYTQFRSVVGGTGSGHRFSFLAHNGDVAPGLEIDHICRNRGCVNPKHLRAVSRKENARNTSYTRKTICSRGHELTPENTYRRPDFGGLRRDCRKCKVIRQTAYEARQALRG